MKTYILLTILLFVIIFSSFESRESLTIVQTRDKNISVKFSSLFKILHINSSKDVNTGEVEEIIPHIKQKLFYPIFQEFNEKLDNGDVINNTFWYKGYIVKMYVGNKSSYLDIRL